MRDLIESTMHVKEQSMTELQKKLVERFWAKEFKLNEGEEWDQEKSNLYQHAKYELKLAEVHKDIYGQMLPDAILEIVKTFAKQGHSGMSAAYSLQILDKLLRFENLTAITDNPEDWHNVSEMCNGDTMYQCKRNPALFSTDGGKTYYHVDEHTKIITAEPFGCR